MKTIHYIAPLLYYDGVQVFEGRDQIGGHYIAVLVSAKDDEDLYLVVGIKPETLRDFRVGALDLRTLLLKRTEREWYLGHVADNFEAPILLKLQKGEIGEKFLPESGFFLHGGKLADSHTMIESRARNNLVLQLTLDPPEAIHEHRIHVNTLSGMLLNFQYLVKHAFGKYIKEQDQKIKIPDAHLLDVVVPAAVGSFAVLLESAVLPDLFGQSEIAKALEKIDYLTETVNDSDATIQRVRQNQGHLAGAYIRFLEFIVKEKCSVQYSWALPSSATSIVRAIGENQASPLYEALSKRDNLTIETVTLVGPLRKVDVDSGTWRLGAYDDEKEHSGKVKENGPSLSNLVSDNKYRFVCEEVIDEITGTGKETRTLYLVEYEKL